VNPVAVAVTVRGGSGAGSARTVQAVMVSSTATAAQTSDHRVRAFIR
jgi:hypothetical protein